MMPVLLRPLILACVATLITGCFGPKEPEDVAADFWEAVIQNDADSVAETSTLNDPDTFDGFDRNWNGYQPQWGKIVIDDRKASIETTLTAEGKEERELTTWLVQRDDEWLVDYKRTARSASGGLFGNLFNKVSELGKELGDKFTQSTEEANLKLDQLLVELEAQQDAFSQQAEAALEAYSAQLEQSLRAMDDSIQQTLNEQAAQLSKAERQTLEDASTELEQRLRAIEPDSLESALENSQALAELRDKLESIDTDALQKQKKEWQALSESLSKDVETLLQDITQ